MKDSLKILPFFLLGISVHIACAPSEKPDVAIHTAAKTGKTEQINRILKTRPDLVNHQNPETNARKRTPLHEASGVAVVEVLLAHGADVNAKDSFSWTPLHTAADGEVVNALVKAGGDVHAKAQRKLTPIHTVQSPAAAAALIRHGADIEAVGSGDITPLVWQIQSSADPDLIAVLLANNANTGITSEGRTLLHMAADRKHARTVQLLLEKGLDVNARDEVGATALHYAAFKDHVDVARTLLDHGADPSVRLSDEASVMFFEFSGGRRKQSVAGFTPAELAESEAMKNLLLSFATR